MIIHLSNIREQAKDLYASDKAGLALLLLYCVIFAGFFFLNTDWHRNIFYISLFFSAYYIVRERAVLKEFWHSFKIPVLLATLFLFYLTLSLLWSDTWMEGRTFDKAKVAFFLPLSLASLVVLLRKIPFSYTWLILSFVGGALCSGIYLICEYMLLAQGGRLTGLGRAENSVVAGLLYAAALLAVCFGKPFADLAPKYRVLAGSVCFGVMLLSQSRGPLLAVAATVGIVLLLKKQFRIVLLAALAGALCLAAIFATQSRDQIPILNRGDTGRTQVWAQSVDVFLEKPFFGHGIGSKFFYEIEINRNGKVSEEQASHPHNAYLATLIQGGIAALALLLSVLTAFLLYGQRLCRTGEYWPISMAALFSIMGLYDFGGIYTNLGASWMAFWFPLTIALALSQRKSGVE